MYTDFTPDINKQRQWYQQISADPRRLDWIIVVDGEDVGLVSIVRIDEVNHRAEWAYYLASPSVRGKGIVSRTCWMPQIHVSVRSMPRPNPPCGTLP